MREHIVPCGIGDMPVTSLEEEGLEVGVREVADIIARLAAQRWGALGSERQDVAWTHAADGYDLSAFSRGAGPGEPVRPSGSRAVARLEAAGVAQGLELESRKPDWLRPKVALGTEAREAVAGISGREDAASPSSAAVPWPTSSGR